MFTNFNGIYSFSSSVETKAKHWAPDVAQIIKIQRQILGFKLKIRKTAKPLKISNFYKIFRLKRMSSCLIPPYIPL